MNKLQEQLNTALILSADHKTSRIWLVHWQSSVQVIVSRATVIG